MRNRIMACRKRESTNEIAGFGGLTVQIPAISNRPESKKQTPAQSLRALFTGDYFWFSQHVWPELYQAFICPGGAPAL
jgi:hypothetical protein